MDISISLLEQRIPELLIDLTPDQIEEYRRLCHVYHNGGWSTNGWYFDVYHSMKSEGVPDQLAHQLASNIGLRLS